MPVLKQHYNTPALKEAIVLDLGDLGAQANKIKLAAEQRATQIINEAQARATRLAEQRGKEAYEVGLENGYEAGHKQGLEEGRTQALAQMQERLNQIDAAWCELAQQWEQQRVLLEREARESVLQFALNAAEKLVHRVIEVDDTVVIDQAGQALSMVLSAHDAKLRIHPVDREILEAALPQLISEVPGMDYVELIEDEKITPGGCIVNFGHGRIDATIEKQIERLVDLILPAPELQDDDEADTESTPDPAEAVTAAPASAGAAIPDNPSAIASTPHQQHNSETDTPNPDDTDDTTASIDQPHDPTA